MANITGKNHLFFVTSPRSPQKMKDEIQFLVDRYSNQQWNEQIQKSFIEELAQSGDFSIHLSNNPALQARDRITRAPKSLGFVNLKPAIQLTPAGKGYLFGKRPHEAFTRQLLKFQLPSPYHIDKGNTFSVRPYLELLRLVYDLQYLSKDEIAIFGVQLTHYTKYEIVKENILNFRQKLSKNKTNRKNFIKGIFIEQIKIIFDKEIQKEDLATRESITNDIDSFVMKKRSNFIDYADAVIRYLRETRLVTLRNAKSNNLRIPQERIAEVEFILNNTSRIPMIFADEQVFKNYLFDPTIPLLLSDNRDMLINNIQQLLPSNSFNFEVLSTEDIKDIKDEIIETIRTEKILRQIEILKSYSEYDDIIKTYADIIAKKITDSPLMMEWNTWRAFTMLDDGDIIGNLNFDDAGLPLSTASGGKADIVCQYANFDLLVEVTLSSGAKQYEMEGEPVPRHIGKHRSISNKETYCIFIAKELNDASIAHFYILHKTNVRYYGGSTKIIPITIKEFIEILTISHKSLIKPSAQSIKDFIEYACKHADSADDEVQWRNVISESVKTWNRFIADNG